MKIPVIRNTVTNYLKVAVFMAEGVLIARWMIHFLGMESYGLWSLLWSFFAYSLLLDFGCGAAAQKYTSGGLYERDCRSYSGVISTIFTFHSAMALLLAAATFGCSLILPFLLGIDSPEKLHLAKICFYLFGLGSTLLFPTGIFPEILVGLQKIYLRNFVIIICKTLELLGVLVIFYCNGGLILLITFVMFTMLLSNLVMGVCVLRLLPRFRLRLAWDREKWKEIISFSGFVYCGKISSLILARSSRVIISIFCTVTKVGVFQLSSKLADLCGKLVYQYQENIEPISGALHKRGKMHALGRIVFGAMRWNAFAATGVILIVFMLADPILQALFKINDPEVVMLSRWFLVSCHISSVLRSVPQSYFIMAGRHKFSMTLLICEAAANLILNISLLALTNLGVAVILWNSIAVKLLIALFFFLPVLIRDFRISIRTFLWKLYAEPLLAGAPSLLWIQFYLMFIDPTVRRSYPELGVWITSCVCGGVAALLYLFFMFRFCPIPKVVSRYLAKHPRLRLWRRSGSARNA